MDERDMDVFLTLARELHFGRTARQLHLSQASVSQTIQKLERRIGAALFDRSSRRVALTPIGRRLREDLEPARQRIREALARATTAARGAAGVLRLGFEAPSLADLVAATLEEFQRRYPDIDLEIREVDFRDPLRMLVDDEVDLLFTLFPVDGPDLRGGPVVYREPMVLAVNAGHPLAGRERVTLDDLAEAPVLRASRPPPGYWVDAGPWLTPAGRQVRRGPCLGTFQELMLAVSRGVGHVPLAAHAARYFARPQVVFVPFVGALDAEWGVVSRTSRDTERIRAFIAVAEELGRRG
ncbi:LysR family transcriptional regulator [Plantactinospora sp. WMMB782]|uniref:LysR family transcriptional regulator n=1 Tax=Plantactinospora sp. WMMB782 TaxID=3404121 RepID=UPI003B962050